MGTPLQTSRGYQALVDGYDAANAKFFALGNATEGGARLRIAKDRTTQNFANLANPVQHENGINVSHTMNFVYNTGFDPGEFADPHMVDVIGQAAIVYPTIVGGDDLTIAGGVSGAPLRITGTAVVRNGFTAYKSPFVRMVRLETDGTITPLITPVAQPEGYRAAVVLNGALPVVMAVRRNGATATGDNAFVLTDDAGAQQSTQEWNYFNGLRVETPASASYDGNIELKTGAPMPSAAVTIIAAFNCTPIGLGT